jgi:endoplasmic reticulum-Golgi intermediate compartment protein 3
MSFAGAPRPAVSPRPPPMSFPASSPASRGAASPSLGTPRGEASWSRAVLRRLKEVDVFARMLKVQDDLQVRTVSGGFLSVAAALLILVLVATETASYLTNDRVQNLTVDPGRNEKLRIHFDVDLNFVNCDIVGVDALDGTGNAQLELTNHMYKTRIDHNGAPIGDGARSRLERVARPAAPAPAGDPSPSPSPIDIGGTPGCGSCMGAGTRAGQCCNTCDEVRKAYEERGWLLVDLHGVPQCVREGRTRLTPGEFNPAEGCNVHGYVEVLKVAGTIHIAPGHSFNFHGRTLHDLSALKDALKDHKLNLSHKFKSLSFGDPFPGIKNPLDNTVKTVGSEAAAVGQHQYFAQVVPTSYHSSNGRVLHTNQYSVTESFRPTDGQLLPGVFVYYNLSPIKIDVVETRRSIFHFLVQLSAIVGGVFSLASMLDAGAFHTVKAMRKRASAPLGKLN